MEERGQPGKILRETTCNGTIITVDNVAITGPSRRKVKDMVKAQTSSAARGDRNVLEKPRIVASEQANDGVRCAAEIERLRKAIEWHVMQSGSLFEAVAEVHGGGGLQLRSRGSGAGCCS